MRTAFRTLLLAGAASLAMSGAALAQQVTLDGIPANKQGVMKITCTDANNGAAQPCFVALSSGGQAVSSTNRFPVNADGSTVTANQGAAGTGEWLVRDGTDGPGTNPGTGARGWLSGLYAKQAAAVPTGTTSTTAQPVQGAGPTAVPVPVSEADGANVAIGAKADTAYAGSGSSSIVAALKGIYNALIAPTPAGTAIIGKVGIDQTTAGTTNGVVANNTAVSPVNVVERGVQGSVSSGIVPLVVPSGNALAVSGPYNVYGAYATNTSSTAGFLVMLNASAVPGAGAAISPVECIPLPASPGQAVKPVTPLGEYFSTGVTAIMSTSCTTYTASTLTGFIKVVAR